MRHLAIAALLAAGAQGQDAEPVWVPAFASRACRPATAARAEEQGKTAFATRRECCQANRARLGDFNFCMTRKWKGVLGAPPATATPEPELEPVPTAEPGAEPEAVWWPAFASRACRPGTAEAADVLGQPAFATRRECCQAHRAGRLGDFNFCMRRQWKNVVDVLDECCATCEGAVCGEAAQDCEDPNLSSVSTGDWQCKCPAPSVGDAVTAGLASCVIDECEGRTLCSDAEQACVDADTDYQSLNDWECQCVAPSAGAAVTAGLASCVIDECSVTDALCETCAKGTCAAAGQACADGNQDHLSLSDWTCTCARPASGMALAAAAACVIDECTVVDALCPTCANGACAAAGQACVDEELDHLSLSDWVCVCPRPSSGVAVTAVATCTLDECTTTDELCTTCADGTCAAAGQACSDADTSPEALSDWVCACGAPYEHVTATAAACGTWWPKWSSSSCEETGMFEWSDVVGTKAECCRKHFNWKYHKCMGQEGKDGWYPSWNGEAKGKCKNDGKAPEWMGTFATAEDCCKEHFGPDGWVFCMAPLVAEPATQEPAACERVLGEWDKCVDAQHCCAEGLYCKVDSQWWGACRKQ